MRRTCFIALALCIAGTAKAYGQGVQDDQLPRALFISQWICPQSVVQEISRSYDSLTVPIEQELVDEGKMFSAGMFFHRWGDEWNVNWYRIGQDNAAVFAALQEIGRRADARHPDAPDRFAECTAHKDNIYFWGPRTTPAPQP